MKANTLYYIDTDWHQLSMMPFSFNSQNLCFKSCGYTCKYTLICYKQVNETIPGCAYSFKQVFTQLYFQYSSSATPSHTPPQDALNRHQLWLCAISSAYHLDDSKACFLFHSDSQVTVYQKDFVFTTYKNNTHPFYSFTL